MVVTQVKQYLHHASVETRIALAILIFFLVPTLVFVAVSQFFMPTGKRRLSDGRESRLPPSLPGHPIIGSLGALKTARADPNHLLVSALLFIMELD